LIQAYIFLGSNIDRKRNYLEALKRLAGLGIIAAISSVYETTPIGGKEGEDFYNGSVLLETDLGARDLKHALRKIEAAMGRIRTDDRNSPRTIDLDLVLYNHDKIDDGDIKIPDPLILERPFLAMTLAELTPDYVHPTAGRTLAEIARSLRLDARGMHLEPGMTALVKQVPNQIYSGEISHA
jgi:2-amino-4-hydroxy-6-hydroxymethyldihydropteridine diphosphokinase